MNNIFLKRLAKVSIINGKVDENIRKFVLLKLTKKDLNTYLSYLKNEIKKNSIYVIIASVPDKLLEDNLSEKFKGKDIVYITDKSLGAGLRIEYEDNILNMNVKSMIDESIQRVKDSI